MRRSAAGAVVIAFAASGAGIASLAIGAPASAAPGDAYYLALGDSLAAGYQPNVGDDKTGGYVGGVLGALQAQDPSITLTNLACSGETTTTFGKGGKCSYPEGNQLDAAVAFLKAHAAEQGVITLDIGANDVQVCAKASGVDLNCVTKGMGAVQANLPGQVAELRAAAPNATIILANYYNPFLASWLQGTDGQALAKSSTILADSLNRLIAGASTASGGKVADVAAAFNSSDFTDTRDDGAYGTIPVNVANICDWTWMCKLGNIHANDIGYKVMADTIIPLLPTLTAPTSSTTTTSSTTSSTTTTTATTTTVSGPPVVTDGPAGGSNEGLVIGAGAAVFAAAGGALVLGRRLRR